MASKREQQRQEKLALFERIRQGDVSDVEQTMDKLGISLGSKDQDGITLRRVLADSGHDGLIARIKAPAEAEPSEARVAGSRHGAEPTFDIPPLRAYAILPGDAPQLLGEFQSVQSYAELLHAYPGAQMYVDGAAKPTGPALRELARQVGPEGIGTAVEGTHAAGELGLSDRYAIERNIPYLLFRNDPDRGSIVRVGEFSTLENAARFLADAAPAALTDFTLYHEGQALTHAQLRDAATQVSQLQAPTAEVGGANYISNGDRNIEFDAELAGIYEAVAARRAREAPELARLREDLGIGAGKPHSAPAADQPAVADSSHTTPQPGRSGIDAIKSLFAAKPHPDAAALEHMDALYRMFRVVDTSRETRFHYKEQPAKVAFADTGSRLRTATNDERVVKAMVQLAEAKGWSTLTLSGSREFRRNVWLEASAKGLRVDGYKPQQHDLFELQERMSKVQSNTIGGQQTGRPQEPLQPGSVPGLPVAPFTSLDIPIGATGVTKSSGIASHQQQAHARLPSPALASQLETQRTVSSRSNGDLVVGQLIDTGTAPYEFKPGEKASPYVTLQTTSGQRTVWGIDLPRALEHGQAQLGDNISLRHMGKENVSVPEHVRDASGAIVETRYIDTQRNAWDVTVSDTRERAVFAAANQFAHQRVQAPEARAMFIQQVAQLIRENPGRVPKHEVFDANAAPQRHQLSDQGAATHKLAPTKPMTR